MRSRDDYEVWIVRIEGDAPDGFQSLVPGGRTDVHVRPRPKDWKHLQVRFLGGTVCLPTAVQRVGDGCCAEFQDALPAGAQVLAGDEVIGLVSPLVP